MQGRYVARGLVDSLTIGAGYVPVAISFGVAALAAGIDPLVVILTSVLVYAGASQFILIALLASGAALWVALPIVLLMNARHLFYGPPVVVQLLQGPRRKLPVSGWAFGLTDEVFATAVTRLPQVAPLARESWYLGLQLGAYGAWVAGTALGIVLSQYLQDPPVFIEQAFAFVLPALFFALLLEMQPRRYWAVLLASGLASALLLLWVPVHYALVLAIVVGAGLGGLKRQHAD